MEAYVKELKSRSMTRCAWLLVFYWFVLGLVVEVGYSIPSALLSSKEEDSCYDPTPDKLIGMTGLFIIQNSLFCVLYPFTGWFSDIVIGRKKALSLSLWLCWLGTLLQCISYCIQYSTCGLAVNIAKFGISGVAFLLIIVGNAGLFTNIPAFGMDQLFDMPHTHSQAFIYWAIWSISVGFFVGYGGINQTNVNNSSVNQMTGLIVLTFATAALCLHIFCTHSFETVNFRDKNPYRLVYYTFKYAWYHNVPERRSAFTYWEEKLPSRIDLGKQKYGGPFPEPDIEDVKICLRIFLIFACTFGCFIPYYFTFTGVISYINEFNGALTTVDGYGSNILWLSWASSVILFVPIIEIFIIPCCPKLQYYMKSPIVGFLLCHVFEILSLILLIILEYLHLETTIDISFVYFSFPLLFSGLVNGLTFVFGLELICSQAPSHMKGMLTGFYWFIRTFYFDVGAIFSLINFGKIYELSSKFWMLIFQLFVCLIGTCIFSATSRWYELSRKNQSYNLHTQVEDIYNRNLSRKPAQSS